MNGTGAGAILAQVTVTAAILYAVNLLLVTAAISASGSELELRPAHPVERPLDGTAVHADGVDAR